MLAIFIIIILLLPKIAFAQNQANQTLTESIQNSYIKQAWTYVMSLVNGIVVLGLIFVALANILRINIETYHIKRMLPAIIIGVILANFSYLICRLFIDFSQVAGDFFLFGHPYPLNPCAVGQTDMIEAQCGGYFIAKIFGIEQLLKMGTGAGAVGAIWIVGGLGLSTGGAILLGALIILIVALLVLVGPPVLLILLLAFLLAVRSYLIWFLVIVSPIAFFSLSFTPLNKVWSMWWSWFIKWVFMAPIAFLFIKLAVIVANVPWPDNTGGRFGSWFFGIILFALAIYMPYMLGGKIVSGWSNLWRSVAGYGIKGARYGGIFTGATMKRWGERSETAAKARAAALGLSTEGVKRGRSLQTMGEWLQKRSFYADMVKELPRIPGGYGMAAALEAKQGRWQREDISKGLHATTAGWMGRNDLDTSYQLKAAEAYNGMDPLSAIRHMTSKLRNPQLKGRAWKMALAADGNPDEIVKAFGPRNKEAANWAVGLSWAFQKNVANGTSESWMEKYKEAFQDELGEDVNQPADINDSEAVKNAKARYNLGYQRVKPIPGIPRGPIMPQGVPPAPGGPTAGGGRPPTPSPPGPEIAGGLPNTPEFARKNAEAVADWIGRFNEAQLEAFKRLSINHNYQLAANPHLEQAKAVLHERGDAQGVKNADDLIQHQQIVTKVQQVLEVDKTFPGQISNLKSKLGQGVITPQERNQAVDLVTRFSVRPKTEVEQMAGDNTKLLAELNRADTAMQSIGHALPEKEQIVSQTTRVKVEPNIEGTQAETPKAPKIPTPPPAPKTTSAGGAETSTAGSPAVRAAKPATPPAPTRKTESAASPVIVELNEKIIEARTKGDQAGVRNLMDARDKLLGKK